jgi:hypothetical protein
LGSRATRPVALLDKPLLGLVSGKGGAIGLLPNTDGATVMTFEDFLRNSGTIDFRVRATPGACGMSCYIHPQDKDGATIDFVVVGDHVSVIKKLGMLPKEDETLLIETSEDAA